MVLLKHSNFVSHAQNNKLQNDTKNKKLKVFSFYSSKSFKKVLSFNAPQILTFMYLRGWTVSAVF